MTTKSHISIVVIIPYFGTFPWYFNYFIHTCKYNPGVDFLIITDDESYNGKVPCNIKFVYQKFEDFKKLMVQRLNLNIAISNTYKLCDFKPAYGYILNKYISDYDFWGIGDIDVIYGNIRSFITDNILENNDVITVRHDFIVGYFTLFRNNDFVNNLYKRSKDYLKVFTSDEHYCFDECNFAFWKLDHNISFDDIADQCEIESMTHIIRKLQKQNKIRAYFDTHAIEGVYGKLVWENGTLIFKNQFEILLYHMIIFKKIYSPVHLKEIPEKFRISPTRIYHC